MTRALTLDDLQQAVAGPAAAFRSRSELQPAGGAGDKVFPPTYAGAVYATEMRRIPGRDDPVPCVLMDSVQSQANRMEEALQQAVDDGRLKLPVVEVDFSEYFGNDSLDTDMQLLDPVGKVSSLQAPHRIADAILRDSLLDGTPFRKSETGKRLDLVDIRNATALFDLCPTALLFGMWDSTGVKGGLGAKFERALVSEIVGIDAVYGVKTSSRIDPLGIQREAGPLYRTADNGWTRNPDDALDEMSKGKPTGKKILYKKNSKGKDVAHTPGDEKWPDQGRPSETNHGNVMPSLKDTKGNELPGGVTIASAEQTIVLSLPALRRLRFPVEGYAENSEEQRKANVAGRTVVAALGLCAAALADEAGLDLRSRCLLYPEADLTWHLLDRTNGGDYSLPADDALNLFNEAVDAAKNAGLPWRQDPVRLTPSEELVKLVVKSQQLQAKQGGDEGDA